MLQTKARGVCDFINAVVFFINIYIYIQELYKGALCVFVN